MQVSDCKIYIKQVQYVLLLCLLWSFLSGTEVGLLRFSLLGLLYLKKINVVSIATIVSVVTVVTCYRSNRSNRSSIVVSRIVIRTSVPQRDNRSKR